MWIVSVDRDFYPFINKWDTYEEALEDFNFLRKTISNESCVFLAKVSGFEYGDDYDITHNPQL